MNVQKVVDVLGQEPDLCRFVLRSSDGRSCAVGALLVAAVGRVPEDRHVQDNILEQEYDMHIGDVCRLMDFNDAFTGSFTDRKRHVINKIKEEYGD